MGSTIFESCIIKKYTRLDFFINLYYFMYSLISIVYLLLIEYKYETNNIKCF